MDCFTSWRNAPIAIGSQQSDCELVKYQYHKFEFADLPSTWLSDEGNYAGIADSDGSPVFAFHKTCAGILTMKFAPSYCQPIVLEEVPACVCGRQLGNLAQFEVIWETPTFRVYVNDTLVATFASEPLAEAAQLGVPLKHWQSMTPMQKYKLKKTVCSDQGDEAWELEEIPNYMTRRHGLRPESIGEFLRKPSNATQKDREVIITWSYAHLLRQSSALNDQISLILPGVDRGVDVFMRVVNRDDPVRAMIPIQICEIPIHACADIEQRFVDTIYAAKKKVGDASATLLCSMTGSIRVELSWLLLRSLAINNGPWPFRRVLLVTSSPLSMITLYDADNKYYLISQDADGNFRANYGRTMDEICGDRGGIPIVIHF